MHLESGEILPQEMLTEEEMEKTFTALREEELKLLEGTQPAEKRPEKLSKFRAGKYRNRPCPCCSGKKFKNCCMRKGRMSA